jgi:predicted nucleic acid-binding protein
LIFLDTNVISEMLLKTPNTAVIACLVRNDPELALPTVTIAEIAFGYRENSPRPEGRALGARLGHLAPPFCRRIFPFTEAAVLAYGDIMSAALRQGRPMTAPDGMIAAITRMAGAWQPGTCRTSRRQVLNSSARGISEAASCWAEQRSRSRHPQ